MILKWNMLLILKITVMLTPSISWGHTCVKSLKNSWANKTAETISNQHLYKYAYKKFGTPTHCDFTEDKSKNGFTQKRLVITFPQSVTITQFAEIPKSTWLRLDFGSNIVDNKEATEILDESTKAQGIRIKWTHFKTTLQGKIETRIYCDEIYGTGSLSVVTRTEGNISSFSYGHIESSVCPISFEQMEKILPTP